MTDLERAKEALTTIDCTCALCRDEHQIGAKLL